jgi:acid phosphatase family membrane protein YuiD
MDDPNYELTTDDIRALSAGISTLVGGTTYLANKRQMNKVTTARDVAEVRTKSGKPAKITQEELAEIQKLDGFEAQNTKFKNITGEELAEELKGRNLNPFSDNF